MDLRHLRETRGRALEERRAGALSADDGEELVLMELPELVETGFPLSGVHIPDRLLPRDARGIERRTRDGFRVNPIVA